MKYFFYFLLFFSSFTWAQVQDTIPKLERTVSIDDDKYREDQFYFGITHSLLTNTPQGYKANSFSTGISFGFLRDFPINKRRNVAIAPGFGLAFYNLRNNFTFNENGNGYFVNSDYSKNVHNLTYLEIPIEFRWRTSTMYSHKFWRIYAGIKYSYLIHNVDKYDGEFGEYHLKSSGNYSKNIIGAYVSAGFNTWNIYAYYGFSPIVKKEVFNNKQSMNFFNLGLMFYML